MKLPYEEESLVAVLGRRAASSAAKTAYIFLADGEVEAERLTYGELDRKACALGALLRRTSSPGDRAVLLFPPGLSFVVAFYGCLYGAVIAVPAYPPKPSRIDLRLRAIFRDCQPRFVLTTRAILNRLAAISADLPELENIELIAVDELSDDLADSWEPPAVGRKDLAFLQYTSGSTGIPKGAMVSHGNLLANGEVMRHGFEQSESSVFVSWLPLYHDMGLIGMMLQSPYVGGECILMSPMAFLQQPFRWLSAVSRYRATITGGPNFAYELCVRKIGPGQRELLDLSSLVTAYNGAEPVRSETVARFSEVFADCGLRPTALYPCYGLAEGTLYVTGGYVSGLPKVRVFDAAALEERRVAPPSGPAAPSRTLVGCGHSWLDQRLVIVDPETRLPCPPDRIGEIWLASSSVVGGYWNRPEQSAETFGARLADSGDGPFLRTGDLGFLSDGELFIAGRIKDVIIVRGRNHYPQDIETTVERAHPALRPGCVAAFALDGPGGECLAVAQELQPKADGVDLEGVAEAIRRAVAADHDLELAGLALVKAGTIPKTSSGKIQRHASRRGFLDGSLEVVGRWTWEPAGAGEPAAAAREGPPAGGPGRAAIAAWLVARLQELLRVPAAGIDPREPLASYGLGSLFAATLAGDLSDWLGRPLSPTLAFDYPTVEALAGHLAEQGTVTAAVAAAEAPAGGPEPIAVVGMACRLPGARNPVELWNLLRAGVDAVSEVPADRWDIDAFYDPDLASPGKMNTRRGGFLEGIGHFDAPFFGVSPREAEHMDPQQRLLLELAWEALEDAGIAAEPLRGSRTGVFVGISANDYARERMTEHALLDAHSGSGSALSIAANRLSYFFDFRGPSVAVDSACSSALVAVQLACQSLASGASSLALAGGVNLILSPSTTIIFSKAGLLAPDGRCKAFDAGADGYVRSEGAGVAVLKPLSRAVADGDRIYAVIRGGAVNQDGRSNGLTAPSRLAQEEVLREACRQAGVSPLEVDYVEAHGSGTALGDSIEGNALAAVMAAGRPAERPCRVGSIKSNLGHLEAAAGIAGLLKVALSLHHRELPPTLHVRQPNPHIPFGKVPLRLQLEAEAWPAGPGPARAGVSSFGFGGTNAHLVLEQAPAAPPAGPSRPWQLLVLSARTPAALDGATAALAELLAGRGDAELADTAHTLQVGRAGFDYRRAVLCQDAADAVRALRAGDPERVFTHLRQSGPRGVAFLLPGLGEQYPGMALELYRGEPAFRDAVDRCAELLRPHLELDLREVLFPAGAAAAGAAGSGLDLRALVRGTAPGQGGLAETRIAQPAVFVVEYALARLLAEWGIRPEAMIGHSLGEYTAACLAGVFSLEDALTVVARRARLIQELPAGAMLAVSLPAAELAPWLADGLSLAAVNGPSFSVLSGPPGVVAAAEAELARRGAACRRLPATHAFHSRMMEPIAGALAAVVASVERRPPRTPFVSNVTGTWITAAEAVDPGYWARHLVATVQFEAGARELLRGADRIFLEVGPGQSLGSFLRQCPECDAARLVLPALRHAQVPSPDTAFLLGTLGKLWLAGVEVDWRGFARHERRRRVALPGYPFERRRYWLETGDRPAIVRTPAAGKREGVAGWFYHPVWEPSPLPAAPAPASAAHWLILDGGAGLGEELAHRLRQAGHDGVTADAGELATAEGCRRLLAGLAGRFPEGIVHLAAAVPGGRNEADLEAGLERGYRGVLRLVQALSALPAAGRREAVRLVVAGSGLAPVVPGEPVTPAHAMLPALCKVISQELPHLRCRAVDLPVPADAAERGRLLGLLAAELAADGAMAGGEPLVALRQDGRRAQAFAPLRLDPAAGEKALLRPRGVYLITGGLGEVGGALAGYLAREHQARLVLVGRSPLPPREAWEEWLSTHDPGDGVSRRLRQVLALEAAGAEVLVAGADVADGAALRRVIALCDERFGALHGVIHAAGIVDRRSLCSVDEMEEERCEVHLRPKVRGTLALAEALAGRELDFCLLLSSISAVLGGLGFGAYAPANLFLDAFACHRRHAAGTPGGAPWISAAWDGWQSPARRVERGGPGETTAAYEMTPEEGIEAFRHVLALAAGGMSQVVISTGDLGRRIEQWVTRPASAAAPAPPAARTLYARPGLQAAYVPAASRLERRIAAVWQRILGLEQVGIHDNFFDLGGNSLIGVQVIAELQRELGVAMSSVALFSAPTVAALAALAAERLGQAGDEPRAAAAAAAPGTAPAAGGGEVAIVGMAGRFPGARDVDELWRRLLAGAETVSFFSDDELREAGVEESLLGQPGYVRARPVLADPDRFDARFFGYSPREATFMDPQHRVFMEVCWQALESAGYDTQQYPGAIGLFAGSNLSTYMLGFYSDPALRSEIDLYQMVVGNDKDSLPTSVSYKLDLRGPSLAVQSHCSTSLVAVHLACQSLLAGECSMALAGGVSVRAPQKFGYRYQEGGQESEDGHTRSFDARATGTVFGDGAAVVVLKRLADAVADGDSIHAVIKGSAINNDGSLKAGYTAPSVEGQSKAVAAALARAGVGAASLRFVEAHGSATPLGDPIEVAALSRAFRAGTRDRGFCALGSVKSNVGHLDRAAGVTGLIKAALAVRHGVIPASLHFERPNPELELEESPFFVNRTPLAWPADALPRRAGVNSLGMGGTNAHVVLEQAPPPPAAGPSRPWQLVLLSARSAAALDAATASLVRHLEEAPAGDFPDVCHTLRVGRRAFEHRRALVCRDAAEAAEALGTLDPRRVITHSRKLANRRVAFLFPGTGDHYVDMGRGLYHTEPRFREALDRCAALLRPLLGADLLSLLYPAGAAEEGGEAPEGEATAGPDLRRMLGRGAAEGAAAGEIHRTRVAQPAVFALEYALAQLWLGWGVRPDSLLGYSTGELLAACLAEVMSLEDALKLVAGRAALIEALPEGAMLTVPLPEEEALALTGAGDGLWLAAVNGPRLCVLSGTVEGVTAAEERLAAQGIACRRLPVSHAFHSGLMEGAQEPLRRLLAGIELRPPRVPYVSNVTGTWITAAEAADPEYWVRHLCGPVRFAQGVAALLEDPDRILLEVGPGQTLGSFVRQHPACDAARAQLVLPSLRNSYERRPDAAFLLASLGRLWAAGVKVDWTGFAAHESRRRLPLPTYPFERQRFWVEPARGAGAAPLPAGKETDLSRWFYVPSWKQGLPLTAGPAAGAAGEDGGWLLFADGSGLGARLAAALRREGRRAVTVTPGAAFAALDGEAYAIDPRRRDDYDRLFAALRQAGGLPRRIVHLWSVGDPAGADTGLDRLAECLDRGFYSLIHLAQALGGQDHRRFEIGIVSTGLQAVSGDEPLRPEKATLIGPCRVIPQEYPNIVCRSVDVALPAAGDWPERTVTLLLRELAGDAGQPVVALRGGHRWLPVYDQTPLGRPEGGETPRLRHQGVYMITGGLGGIGLGIAACLARTVRAKLVLVGRSALPPRSSWEALAAGDDANAGRLRQLLALEAEGSEVLALAADVADTAAMTAVVARTLERFGTLHGVVHAAGVPGAGIIQLKTPEAAARVLAPKVHGTLVLESLLAPLDLDFLALFGSVSSINGGGPGQVDYCAANAFLDAFAHSRAGGRRLTVSIDWSEWQWDAWQEALLGFSPEIQEFLRESRRRYGIELGEGAEAFLRVLTAGLPQVVVATQSLQALIDLGRTSAELLGRLEGGRREAHPRPLLGTPYVAPAGDVECRLAAVWGEALGLQEVGRHDDFFELGGHSLLATQLFSRLRDVFEVDLPLRAIFETPTLEELAAVIEQARSGAGAAAPPPVTPMPAAARRQPLPLSFAQQRLWFLDQLAPGSALYNDPAAFRLRGRLEVAALGRALDEIRRRHEILRTTFPESGGLPFQHVEPAAGLPLPVVDLSALPPALREGAAAALAADEAGRPFDLARGPLVRATLLRLEAQEHVLLFMTHHIVNDGWSGGVIGRELTAFYAAFSRSGPAGQGRPEPLPELPIQYADYAVWQRSWMRGEVLERQLAYWRERLRGHRPELALPADRPRPAVPSYRGASEPFTLPQPLSRSLHELARAEGASLFMTLLAGLFTFLHRLTGERDIVVGTDIAGRTRREVEPLIGFFVNILLLRADLGGDPTFRQLLGRVREVALGAYAHQDLPFEKLVEELEPDRSLGAAPLFRVLFVLQNAGGGAIELPGLTLTPFPVDSGTAKFDLVVVAVEREDGGLEGVFRYSVDLFDRDTVRRMASRFTALLQGIAARPDARLNELERLPEPERTKRAMDIKTSQESEAGKLRFARRRAAVDLSQVSLVRMGPLLPGSDLPLLIEPATEDVDLIEWAKHNRQTVEEKLLQHGALLFRGFGVASPDEFERFTRALCPELFGGYGDLPREVFGGDIYGSTPYPPDKVILFHNESSQMHHWPLKQWFYCVTPAQQGGETPIADGREVYRRLDPAIRGQFAGKGLMYVRNFSDGLDVSWEEFFRTADRELVERYCRESGIACEWNGNRLTTRRVNPAVARHPRSGELVFFNQIQAHHVSCLEPEVRGSLLSLFGEEGLPRNVYFGDGSPIPDAVVDEVRRVYDEVAVSFPWRQGDVLMLDNMLTAHSRNAFVGPRKIMVAMGDMVSSADVAAAG